MQQPGRKSGASLTVVQPSGALEVVQRPRPPGELTQAQAEVWVSVVESRAADWFGPETHGLLVAYCVHLIEARKLDALLNECDLTWLRKARSEDLAWREKLVREREMHTRASASLAKSMRLTQSSQIRADAKANRPRGPQRPWESPKG